MKKTATFTAKVSRHGAKGKRDPTYAVGRIASKELNDFIGKKVKVKVILLKEVEA
jgi:hypothetical protein